MVIGNIVHQYQYEYVPTQTAVSKQTPHNVAPIGSLK